MTRKIEIAVSPEVGFDGDRLEKELRQKAQPRQDEVIRLRKRSIDARGRSVKVRVSAEVMDSQDIKADDVWTSDLPEVSHAPQAVIVGAGPAGLFAAIQLIELGVKPVILERGKAVRERRRDIAAINRQHVVNPESNYCFGEGGAGTYSDGKLYTRSNKRGNLRRVLEIFVAHGATEDILIDAHPHIGTNRLPKIISSMRETIVRSGGEVHFNKKVTDLLLEGDRCLGVTTADGDTYKGIGVILATGHSARDIFELLDRKKIKVEAKPFALGVRVEHAQKFIDAIQYNMHERGPYLPASAYSLVTQVKEAEGQKGVFSFCMCPGGFIVPSATEEGEVVVNGMSPSRRDSRFANSGIVTSIELEDMQPFAEHGPLAGLRLQQDIERRACAVAGGTQAAPAQLLEDFVKGRRSESLLETSYQPGLVSVDLAEILPAAVTRRLRQAFIDFDRKMKGFLTNQAQVVGVETRTSSPVRIPRDSETLEHIEVNRLYPCGEGAGYAGGIVSAAIDGERCALALAHAYHLR